MTQVGLQPFERPEAQVVLITQRILEYLIKNGAVQGTKLPSERKLADALGVGRSAIREAVKGLTVLGLLEARSGDGTYVRASTSDILPQVIGWGLMLGSKRVSDLVELRFHLEPVVAELAARRRDEEDLADLRRLCQTMDSATEVHVFVEADIDFHLGLAKASRNTVLLDVLTGVQTLLRDWIHKALAHSANLEMFAGQHGEILEAVEAGQPERARSAAHAHMVSAHDHLMGYRSAVSPSDD